MTSDLVYQPNTQQLMPVTVDEAVAQVVYMQKLMAGVMREGEHFGKIPGCGPKPALLKAGAEKLATCFRLDPSFEIQTERFENGHREYTVTCILHTGNPPRRLGSGIGCCSTMEKKYRYVSNRERSDIADVYNTVLKMAKKRAMVDAVLTVTAASDIFTQDIEDYGAIDAVVVKEIKQENPAPKTIAISKKSDEDAPQLSEQKIKWLMQVGLRKRGILDYMPEVFAKIEDIIKAKRALDYLWNAQPQDLPKAFAKVGTFEEWERFGQFLKTYEYQEPAQPPEDDEEGVSIIPDEQSPLDGGPDDSEAIPTHEAVIDSPDARAAFLAAIDVEQTRSGIDATARRAFLKEQFGTGDVRGLSDPQILDYLDHLKQLPTKIPAKVVKAEVVDDINTKLPF